MKGMGVVGPLLLILLKLFCLLTRFLQLSCKTFSNILVDLCPVISYDELLLSIHNRCGKTAEQNRTSSVNLQNTEIPFRSGLTIYGCHSVYARNHVAMISSATAKKCLLESPLVQKVYLLL